VSGTVTGYQVLEYRSTGVPEYWSTGVLEYRSTGMPEHRNTESGIPEKLDSDFLEAVTLLLVAPRF